MIQLRHLAVEFFDYYENITATDLIVPGTRAPNQLDLHSIPGVDCQLVCSTAILRIYDKTMTSVSGLLGSEMAILGSLSIQTAVCLPASCTGQHMETLLRQLFQQLLDIKINSQLQVINEDSFQTAESKTLDALTIFTIMFTQHALFSVDSYFFLSGLLVVMVALRTMEKSQGKLNVPLMYAHRYLRLTSVLAVAILVYLKIVQFPMDFWIPTLSPATIPGSPHCYMCRIMPQ
ncbi:hypothetical protein ACLKA7_006079 [Drosophila subpalustris]